MGPGLRRAFAGKTMRFAAVAGLPVGAGCGGRVTPAAPDETDRIIF
jgi:hypothetical protein